MNGSLDSSGPFSDMVSNNADMLDTDDPSSEMVSGYAGAVDTDEPSSEMVSGYAGAVDADDPSSDTVSGYAGTVDTDEPSSDTVSGYAGSLDSGGPSSDLVSRYADMLVRVGYTYLKNMQDAEDIAQEAFLKLFENSPAFENEEHRKAWLLRVAMNLSVNRLRSSWFRKKCPLEEKMIPFTARENTVLDAVQQLPVKYRIIIHLYYIEGYSISEIGSLLGRKDSTVGSQMHRARAILRTKLEEDFDV